MSAVTVVNFTRCYRVTRHYLQVSLRCSLSFNFSTSTKSFFPCETVGDPGHLSLPSIQDVRNEMISIVRKQLKDSESGLLSSDAPVLTAKHMRDGCAQAVIPLASDQELRRKYVTFWRTGTRFGRVMEDLDTMAGYICFKHNNNLISNHCLSFVTALVDRIEAKDGTMCIDQDIKLTGHVSWVGKTSMDISIKVEQLKDKIWKHILDTHFLMVARDPIRGKGMLVNPLEPQGPEEKTEFDSAAAAQAKRHQEAKDSLLKKVPTQSENQLVHDMFLRTIDAKTGSFRRIKPDGTKWIEDTILKTVLLCHLEDRNIYGKIFGGFLMRQAFELAWTSANLYCQSPPVVRAVDDILFKAPVEIGSLLFLSSQIVYTLENKLVVRVHAEVVDAATTVHTTTNTFYFVFEAPKLNMIPPVIPKTYAEAMMYLDGKRHFES